MKTFNSLDSGTRHADGPKAFGFNGLGSRGVDGPRAFGSNRLGLGMVWQVCFHVFLFVKYVEE